MTHPRRTPCAAASVRPRRGTSRASTRALPQRTPRSTPRCLPRLSPPSRRVKSSPPVRVFSFQPAPAQQCISFSARDYLYCRGENASPSSRSRFFRCFATHPRPVEGAIFSTALFAAKGPKDDNRAKWPFITPERTVVALENPTYILRWSLRTTRRAFHASASVFAVPDPEVSETRGSWFAHPAMPLGFGALCAVPGATSWCVFCPFSRCQRVPYRNVAMPIDARVRPPRAVPGDPRARVGLPRSKTPRTSSPPPLTPRPRPPVPPGHAGSEETPLLAEPCAGAMAPSAVPPRPAPRGAHAAPSRRARRFSGMSPISSPSRSRTARRSSPRSRPTRRACTPSAWSATRASRAWCCTGA